MFNIPDSRIYFVFDRGAQAMQFQSMCTTALTQFIADAGANASIAKMVSKQVEQMVKAQRADRGEEVPTMGAETGVEVELLNLDAVVNSLKTIRRHKGNYAAFWYKGIQRIIYRDVIEDTLDLRRVWPLCPDHLDKPDLWERIPYSKWNSWPWYVKLFSSQPPFPSTTTKQQQVGENDHRWRQVSRSSENTCGTS